MTSKHGAFSQDVKMKVNAMQQVVDASQPTGLRDVETPSGFPTRKFSEALTQHYDEVAQESPIFLHMKVIVKLLWLTRWLVSSLRLSMRRRFK